MGKAGGRDRTTFQGVGFMGIEAQRDNQGAGREFVDEVYGVFDCTGPDIVLTLERQGL